MKSNNTMKVREWIKSKVTTRSRISWVLTLIIATILSSTIVNIEDSILKFGILSVIVALALFGLLFTYFIDFYKDYERIMQSERVPLDVILETEAKKVIFDDVTFTEKTAEVRVFRELHNNMTITNETYNRYKIIIKSHTEVPHLEDITLTRGNNMVMVSKLDREITQPKQCLEIDRCELNITDPLKKVVEFFAPLYLKAGKTCNFEISYRTKAYDNALNARKDYIQMQVNRIINQLSIEVILQGSMKKEYKVCPCIEDDGTTLTHKIFDASSERMRRTESQLNGQPEYNGDNARWSIQRPKIGYNYQMYFRLLPRNS